MDGMVQSVFATLLFLILSCSVLTEANYLSCPPVTLDSDGTCTDECSSDVDCTEENKCCPSVCGRMCTKPSSIPYHSPYLVCPEVTNTMMAGICSEECGDGCGSGELCCSNGCGHACMQGVIPYPLCRHLREHYVNSSLVGVYVPMCEDDGSFSIAQCHASTGYCWCVAADSGVPISDLIRFRMPQCNCTYGGQGYSVGETFMSIEEGSCNVCSCSVTGEIQCTYTPCQNAVSTQENIYYSCPAIRPTNSPENCKTNCQSHSDCSSSLHCCYDGCGYSCIQPTRIPYIQLPSPSAADGCPSPSSVPCAKTTSSNVSCMDDGNSCSSSNMCCENSCSEAVCLSTVDSTPCFSATEIVLLSNSSLELLGSYKPLCTTQGLFRGIQCHEHYCWCVETQSGKPLSDIVPFERADVLECAVCVYNGMEFKHLENFPSGDGCNTCTCIGGTISCSRVECVDYEDRDDSSEVWGRWYSVLIACVIIVVVLVAIVLALLVGVMILMRQNGTSYRQFKLKEDPNLLQHEHEMVEYRGGHESVELKVPMEDSLFTSST